MALTPPTSPISVLQAVSVDTGMTSRYQQHHFSTSPGISYVLEFSRRIEPIKRMHTGKHTQSPAYTETVTVPTLERLGCLVLEVWFLSCDYIWPRELNSKRIWSSVSGRGLAVLVLISVSEDSNNKVNSPEKGRKYSSHSFDPTFYQKVLLLD